MPTSFRNQNYAALKKDCLAKGVLFEDPEFPASSKSLYFSKVDNDVQWARPKELCKVPKLIVEGVSCDDLNTGELNNAWFVTACSSLAREPKMWQKVVPDHKTQEWDEKNAYAGIFHFNFWRFGEWVDVVIDDRLPVKDGKLVFCHSKAKNEYWSALLEKAYAKLFGDYETLQSGHTADALVDFTGGVSEHLDTTMVDFGDAVTRKAFFNKLLEASENKAFINCHIRCDPTQIGTPGPHGLINGQGYNVSMVRFVEVKKGHQGKVGQSTLQLVRIFNPWSDKEWTGPWSDHSEEWKKLSPSEWEKMGVKFESEGEFWMSFDDFVKYFTDVDICHSVNTSFFTLKKTWQESIMFSEWSSAGRNGGNVYDSATFLSNPQYLFDIPEEEDKIMISLEQRDVTAGRVAVGAQKNTIGFYIMKVEANRAYRVHIPGRQMFRSCFIKHRSVFGSCTLHKGRYVIVPCTENNNAQGQFMLRLYTSNKAAGKELSKECPVNGCCSKYKLVTTIDVEMVDGLEHPETIKGTLDPLIIIRCEGEKIQSDFQKNTRSPKFDLQATFYRKKPDLPIIVEVHNHNRVFNDYLCEARVNWPEDTGNEKGEKKTFNLYGRKKEAEVVKPGTLHVFIRSSDDLSML